MKKWRCIMWYKAWVSTIDIQRFIWLYTLRDAKFSVVSFLRVSEVLPKWQVFDCGKTLVYVMVT